MERGQGNLGGSHQVLVVLGQVVDVVGGLAEEPGSLHRRGLDEGRRDHRGESPLRRLGHRQVQQGELQLGADAGEDVEAGAGDLGASLHVDRAEGLADLEMVLGLESLRDEVTWGTDGLLDDSLVLATSGNVVNDNVAEGLGEFDEFGVSHVSGLLEVGDLAGNRLGASQQLGLLAPGRLGNAFAQPLLFSTQVLVGGDGLTASLVSGDDVVDDRGILAAGDLGAANGIRIRSQELGIDHVADPTGQEPARS